ncbi:DUF6545 domain-containing protein [Streptomyces qinglanensis]|uniref:DUF6545 domain-containing protein n=1 Tax=Streptomyces qinglanensis TaxID=943816 RepID=UPI003D71B136
MRNPSDTLAYLIAAILVVQAGLRIRPALKGQRRDRSLWGAVAGFTGAWLFRTSDSHAFFQSHGAPDLPYFLKHVCALLGICALLRYFTAVHRSGAVGGRGFGTRLADAAHRLGAAATLATVTGMGIALMRMSPATDPESVYFVERHAGNPFLSLYMALFYGFWATATAIAALQWAGPAKRAPLRSLRVGMRMMAVAMALGTVYALVRIIFVLWSTGVRVSPEVNAQQETVTDILLYGFFLLWGLGSLVPALHTAHQKWLSARRLCELHPLWSALARHSPTAVRHPAATYFTRLSPKCAVLDTIHDVFLSPAPSLPARLSRFAIDIRDVIAELRRTAPHGLADAALAEAWARPHPEHPPVVLAEAWWLCAALSFPSSARDTSSPYPFGASIEPHQEIDHLRQVAAAFRLLTASACREADPLGRLSANARLSAR